MNAALRARASRSVLVVDPGAEVIEGGRACLAVLGAIGWRVGFWTRPPAVWLVEAAYRTVAANRGRLTHRWSRDPAACTEDGPGNLR